MSRSVNQITIIGHVGREPDLRHSNSGMALVNFSVATSYKSKGEERTDWHRCTAFDKTADFISQYVRKGDRVYVQGSMQYGSYEKDGAKVNTAEIMVREVIILSANGERAEQTAGAPTSHKSPFEPDDDLGF